MFNKSKPADTSAARAKFKTDLDVSATHARQSGLSEAAIVAELRVRVDNFDRNAVMNRPTAQGYSVEKVASMLSRSNDAAPTLAKLAR